MIVHVFNIVIISVLFVVIVNFACIWQPTADDDGRDGKKEDSPGFWDDNPEDDFPTRKEKKEESPGFWDEHPESDAPIRKETKEESPGFWDENPESDIPSRTEKKEESPGFWDDNPESDGPTRKGKKEESPGCWDENPESDGRNREEKKAESPGFWDENPESDVPTRNEKKEESSRFGNENPESDISNKQETKEEKETPGFWDENPEDDFSTRKEKKGESSGFWDENPDGDSPTRPEKKEESPGFWDESPEDDFPTKKDKRGDSPGFGDQSAEGESGLRGDNNDESPGSWDDKEGGTTAIKEQTADSRDSLDQVGKDFSLKEKHGGSPGFGNDDKDGVPGEGKKEESPGFWDDEKEEGVSSRKEHGDDQGSLDNIEGDGFENKEGNERFGDESGINYANSREKEEDPDVCENKEKPVEEQKKDDSAGFWDETEEDRVPTKNVEGDDNKTDTYIQSGVDGADARGVDSPHGTDARSVDKDEERDAGDNSETLQFDSPQQETGGVDESKMEGDAEKGVASHGDESAEGTAAAVTTATEELGVEPASSDGKAFIESEEAATTGDKDDHVSD